MAEETLLLNPGPVVLSSSIREALGKPMISHRSAAFETIYEDVRDGLRHIYTNSRADGARAKWSGEIVLMNATATLGMEASIANFVDADDTVLALINGNFGRRFAQIAGRHCTVETVERPWGESFDTDVLTERILEGDYDLVTAVHTETSSGLRNPLGDIGAAVDQTDALFVVDGVSSIGGERLHPDEWGIDVSFVDAQKAMAASPGLCAVFLSDDAIDALEPEQTYFYADLYRHLERSERRQTPFTSAVSLFYALQAGLNDIRAVGVEAWLDRHARYARAWERAATEMGLDLFAQPAGPSGYANTVTAIHLPQVIKRDPEPFFSGLRDRGVFVGGGHGHLSGEIFRLGTMGNLQPADLERGIEVVGDVLNESGAMVDIAAGRTALRDALEAVAE